jgi:uncharacterized protein DUF3883
MRWESGSGLPTLHVIHAALHAASVVDAQGSLVADAGESYWHHATGGVFAPDDMRLGERLLIDCGLMRKERDRLYLTAELEAILEGSLDNAVTILCERSLERTTRTIGAIGEEITMKTARDQLNDLGYPELAREVRQVSLDSDALGYDISAPRVVGARRLLEVKTALRRESEAIETFTFHISRNEAKFGKRTADWALVAAEVTNTERREGSVIGWCGGNDISQYLPTDSSAGRWEQAEITLPLALFSPGIPSPVL